MCKYILQSNLPIKLTYIVKKSKSDDVYYLLQSNLIYVTLPMNHLGENSNLIKKMFLTLMFILIKRIILLNKVLFQLGKNNYIVAKHSVQFF